MSAVHFVSADAPPDPCDVTHKCKFFTITLSKVCSDEVQRVANWHCITHGLEGAVLMEFNNKEAVVSATEWVIRHSKDYKALRHQGPPAEAFFGGEKADEALEKANALETLFLRQPIPGLMRLCWLTEEDEGVDDDLKMVMTNAGDFSSDGGVVRIVVQDGGEEVHHQRVAITSVVMPLTAEELFSHRR